MVNKGVMFRFTQAPDLSRLKQLCLHKKFHEVVLKSLHDGSGHLEFDKTYGFVKERFYWLRMKVDVAKYCQTCARCVKRMTLPNRAVHLSHLSSSGPNDLVCISIRMSFIARYIYTYKEFVFVTENTAVQQNDSDRTKT